MGWVVQINPTSPPFQVTFELVQALEEFVEDFHLRYCFVDPERADQAAEALEAFQTSLTEEREAVSQMIDLLRSGDEVELLFGF